MSFRDWQVGDRVVCVNAGNIGPGASDGVWLPGEALEEGRVYTIRRVYIFEGDTNVWLNEVARSTLARLEHGPDVGYGAERFRKVEPRKTSISVFTRFLLNPNAPVREDA